MSSDRVRLAIFLSGRGSGFQNLFRATEKGLLSAEIVYVVSSSSKAGGLKLAISYGFETFVYCESDYESAAVASADMVARLKERRVEQIALAGYLRLFPPEIVQAYRNRITNIHPALLPKFGGKGMFGRHVHEAVIDAGEIESGATVHLVDERYDHGQILEQSRVTVYDDDSPETLSARVLIEEHKIYPQAIENLIQGKYEIEQ